MGKLMSVRLISDKEYEIDEIDEIEESNLASKMNELNSNDPFLK
jgi:hypothetical protein